MYSSVDIQYSIITQVVVEVVVVDHLVLDLEEGEELRGYNPVKHSIGYTAVVVSQPTL